jgi:hypothetical protein
MFPLRVKQSKLVRKSSFHKKLGSKKLWTPFWLFCGQTIGPKIFRGRTEILAGHLMVLRPKFLPVGNTGRQPMTVSVGIVCSWGKFDFLSDGWTIQYEIRTN